MSHPQPETKFINYAGQRMAYWGTVHTDEASALLKSLSNHGTRLTCATHPNGEYSHIWIQVEAKKDEWVVYCTKCGIVDHAPSGAMMEATARQHKKQGNAQGITPAHEVLLGQWIEEA